MALTVQENVRDELSRDFAGELIAPGDAGYEEARLVVERGDRQEAVADRPLYRNRGRDRWLKCARANRQDVAIRGGGHSNAGHGMIDGGMVIDCSKQDTNRTK